MSTYNFSITAASLRLPELQQLAAVWEAQGPQALHPDLLQAKPATAKRLLSEHRRRLQALTPAQRRLLAHGSPDEQRHMGLMACLKCYAFLADFMAQVVRPRFLLFQRQLTPADLRTFMRLQSAQHPEIDALSDLSYQKVQQVVFRIFQDAAFWDNGQLLPPFYSQAFLQALAPDPARYLLLLPDAQLDALRHAD